MFQGVGYTLHHFVASYATTSAVTEVVGRYEVAKVSVTVASRIRLCPERQGISQIIRSLTISVRDRPGSFLMAGRPA